MGTTVKGGTLVTVEGYRKYSLALNARKAPFVVSVSLWASRRGAVLEVENAFSAFYPKS